MKYYVQKIREVKKTLLIIVFLVLVSGGLLDNIWSSGNKKPRFVAGLVLLGS